MHWAAFERVAASDNFTDLPILRTSCLADICHCSSKIASTSASKKELARVGLNSFGMVSGTGDGGGEDEGSRGIHEHLENMSPWCARRRRVPHMAWRTCGPAIKATRVDLKGFAACLSDGVTWSRLNDVATMSVAPGALGSSPPPRSSARAYLAGGRSAIIVTRPDADLQFL